MFIILQSVRQDNPGAPLLTAIALILIIVAIRRHSKHVHTAAYLAGVIIAALFVGAGVSAGICYLRNCIDIAGAAGAWSALFAQMAAIASSIERIMDARKSTPKNLPQISNKL
jgi:hypothetical protein